MTAKSDYLENALVNHVLRGIAYTSPANIYCALFTVIPTDNGTSPNFGGTEVSGGGYARMPVSFAAPSNGQVASSTDLTYPAASGSSGTVVAFALIDALTGGNMLYYGSLTTPKTVTVGDIFEILAGQLVVSEL